MSRVYNSPISYLCHPFGPVVQRIVRRFPEPKIGVRFPAGLQSTLMKYFYILIWICSYFVSHGQENNGWDLPYQGSIVGINATLTGKSTGTSWSGKIDASGYLLTLEGSLAGDQCTGTMSDPQTQAEAPFTALLDNRGITITIVDINPVTGQEEEMHFVFVKSSSLTPGTPAAILPTQGTNLLDMTLVGTWRYTETYVSGDFSVATDYLMQFNADGIVYVTDGRSAGGGASSSFDSGAGDVHQGTWKTENKVLWLNDGQSGWQPYARYYTEPSRMMLTFADGKNQVWEKL